MATSATRLLPPQHAEEDPETAGRSLVHTFSPAVGFCFAVNYILGIGVLNVPYATFAAGIVQSRGAHAITVPGSRGRPGSFLSNGRHRSAIILDHGQSWSKDGVVARVAQSSDFD